MRSTLIALGLISLSHQILAGPVEELGRRSMDAAPGNVYLNNYANNDIRRRADALMSHVDLVERMAEAEAIPMPIAQAAASTVPSASQPSTIIPTVNQTQASCNAALSTMNGVPDNPSGMSACYNIDLFDNSTGDFRAHVIIYQIGAPSGQWTDLKPKSQSVDLQFPGASVAPGPSLSKRDIEVKKLVNRASAPLEMQDLVFVGQIDMQYMDQTNNATAMRMALTPNLQMSAQTTSGQNISVVLSNKDASFVDGFFSNLAASTSDTVASPTPFVLPGVTLGIFPTGLIITCIWTLLFIVTLGLGTWGRKQFRDSYRRRLNPGFAAAMSGKKPSTSQAAAYDKPSYVGPQSK